MHYSTSSVNSDDKANDVYTFPEYFDINLYFVIDKLLQ